MAPGRVQVESQPFGRISTLRLAMIRGISDGTRVSGSDDKTSERQQSDAAHACVHTLGCPSFHPSNGPGFPLPPTRGRGHRRGRSPRTRTLNSSMSPRLGFRQYLLRWGFQSDSFQYRPTCRAETIATTLRRTAVCAKAGAVQCVNGTSYFSGVPQATAMLSANCVRVIFLGHPDRGAASSASSMAARRPRQWVFSVSANTGPLWPTAASSA